jgi:hypothetical protein
MDPALPPLIAIVTLIITTGAVLILRPVSRRLGALLEAMTAERMRPQPGAEISQIRELLTGIDSRLAMLEERQDFAEALISSGDPKLVALRASAPPQEHN